MIAGWLGRGIIFPGQGLGSTGVLHHGACQKFSFVFASCWWGSSTGIKGLPGCWMVQLWSISLGDGMLGAIDVDCSSSRRVSRDVLASWAVLSTVFSVFTCCSKKPFDQWIWEDDVMWLMDYLCRNLSNSSTVKGGMLSVYKMLGAILGYDVVKSLDKGLGWLSQDVE